MRFAAAERDHVRERLLALAEADPAVTGAAITGSHAKGGGDEWSDVDLAFGVRGEVAPAIQRWTDVLYQQFGALHHWDLPFDSTIYRVYLLPQGLEVDIAFTPEADFGPRGPNWRTVFGETVALEPTGLGNRDEIVGLAWHQILHARACVARGKPWQAEYLIGAARHHVLALGCLRLGLPTRTAKGDDLLPNELTAPLEDSLVRSLEERELRRALTVVAAALLAEVERADPALATRLRPILSDLAPIL